MHLISQIVVNVDYRGKPTLFVRPCQKGYELSSDCKVHIHPEPKSKYDVVIIGGAAMDLQLLTIWQLCMA